MASSLLHHAGFPAGIIDKQLAHVEPDEVKAATTTLSSAIGRQRVLSGKATPKGAPTMPA